MLELQQTLANLAPRVTQCMTLPGEYNPRRGLAIYALPASGYSPASPGVVLGEALAARSGLGCTLLEGIPARIPEGAVVVGDYNLLRANRPDLIADIPELREPGQYAVRLGHHALVTAPTGEGLATGMQTLAMMVLRHAENTLPGALVIDAPLCSSRGLAVEVRSGELGVNLLMQMVSFAATFKANRLHLILGDDFDPGREIPGVEAFTAACASFGIGIGVRLPWLGRILSGQKTVGEIWSNIRAVARVFGASEAALDDPAPPDPPEEVCQRIVDSLMRGEVGLRTFSLDAWILANAVCRIADLRAMGVSGWYRMHEAAILPPPQLDGLPVRLDIQAPVPGFSAKSLDAYFQRLDAATTWLFRRERRKMFVSFRNIGVSHLWQNMLYPAATGLIAAWGRPEQAEQCAWVFANLLYGESAVPIMDMWDTVASAFPAHLSPADETVLRQTAYGAWPEEDGFRVLAAVDWAEVATNVRAAAETLKATVDGLSRNAGTLTGARLALYALSWLHCFHALLPELERRRSAHYDEDGRTEPIAKDLYTAFLVWQTQLREMVADSGLELPEMDQVESMGLRLKGLCEGIFE
ncbi:MAG: hypothetical protein LIP77_11180 [Planctomycetes bacterium]|nr:hypothetical protein [Planctomycetota bacterium]